MSTRSCRVTIRDLEGVEHTVCVTADTLYEAIAHALKALRGSAWVSGIPEGMEPIKVCVTDIPVEHTVAVKDFTKWLIRDGGSPRDRPAATRSKRF